LAGGQKRPEQLLDVLPRAPELRAVSPAAAAAELNGCRPSSCTAGKEAHTESRTGVTARVLVDSHVGATEGLKDVHQWRLRSRAGLPRPGQNRRRPRARAVRPRPLPRTANHEGKTVNKMQQYASRRRKETSVQDQTYLIEGEDNRDLVAPLGKRTAATRPGGARPCGRMYATIASTTPAGNHNQRQKKIVDLDSGRFEYRAAT